MRPLFRNKLLIAVWLIFAVWVSPAFAQSPEGTQVPPAASISIPRPPDVWSLGAQNPSSPGNYYVLRNGAGVNGASASLMELCKGIIYVVGRDKNWWAYGANGWASTKSPINPCPAGAVSKQFGLSWQWAPSAENISLPSGFRVYRNGVSASTIAYPALATSDTVTAVPGTQVCYEVSAFNSEGESIKSNTACVIVQ